MPQVFALIPFLFEGAFGTASGLATTAALTGLATTGVGLANSLSQPGPQAAPAAPVTPPPNAQTTLQQRQLTGQQSSDLQSSGSGDLGSNFVALMAPYLAGISGQPGANAAGQYAANQNWTPANSQPTNAAVNGQPVDLSNFINSSI
jgi:hypothetical protein